MVFLLGRTGDGFPFSLRTVIPKCLIPFGEDVLYFCPVSIQPLCPVSISVTTVSVSGHQLVVHGLRRPGDRIEHGAAALQ